MTVGEYKYYAEMLERIKCVSLAVELQEDNALDGLVINIEHQDTVTINNTRTGLDISIPLGNKVLQMTQEQIQTCAKVRDRTLSIRIPLEGPVQHDRSSNFLMSLGSKYKWNAQELKKTPTFKFSCIQCSQFIFESQDITSISEMPSELWAEMMDFWHCHKPHEGHQHQHTHNVVHPERFSTLKPSTNAIVTATYYFAMRAQDPAFNVIEGDDGQIYCSGCKYPIGEHDRSSGLDKLFKWRLQMDNGETYDARNYVYNSLLDNVNGSATRMVEYVSEKNEKLLLWVFNIGFDYVTSTGLHRDAIKLYYTMDSETIADTRKERGEIEVVDVPQEVFESTWRYLVAQQDEIPLALSTLNKHWKLGLLSQ